MDKFDRSWNAKYVEMIKSVSDSGLETSLQALEGTVGGSGNQFTRELNPVILEDLKFDPYIPTFRFPLAPGKKWDGTYSFSREGVQLNGTRASRVEGWETVKTAAGEFKALKITYSGRVWTARGFSNNQYGTSWYSPEVRRVVLSEFKAVQPPVDQRVELVSFKPAP